MAMLRKRTVLVEAPDGRIMCRRFRASIYDNWGGLIKYDVSLMYHLYIDTDSTDLLSEIQHSLASEHNKVTIENPKSSSLFSFSKTGADATFSGEVLHYLKINSAVEIKEFNSKRIELIDRDYLLKVISPNVTKREITVGDHRLKGATDFRFVWGNVTKCIEGLTK